jgi:hypothetical protein
MAKDTFVNIFINLYVSQNVGNILVTSTTTALIRKTAPWTQPKSKWIVFRKCFLVFT